MTLGMRIGPGRGRVHFLLLQAGEETFCDQLRTGGLQGKKGCCCHPVAMELRTGDGLGVFCFTHSCGLPCQQPPGCEWAGRGWAHRAGGPAGQPCVCATVAPAGLGSWLSSSHTAPQSPGSPAGRLSPEGWSARAGPWGEVGLVRGHRSVRGQLGGPGGP